jgi:hypothetical protein
MRNQNNAHLENNIVSRKRKARSRKAHLRRLQGAYDRLLDDYWEFAEMSIESLSEVQKTIKQTVTKEILAQLNHLVSKGLLTVVTKEGKFVRDGNTDQVIYHPEVEFQVNDKEYIEKLELQNDKLIGENKYLRQLIKNMSQISLEEARYE